MQAGNQQQQQEKKVAQKQAAQTVPDTQALTYCPHCGGELDEGADFCGDCGKPVSEEATAKSTAPAKPETAATGAELAQAELAQQETVVNAEPEPEVDDEEYDFDDNYEYEPEDEPVVIEEEPVRKSFLSNNQMASIRQSGTDIDETNRQRAEAARIAEQKRREEEQRRQEAAQQARIAEEKRQAQIAEQRRQEAAAQQVARQAAEQAEQRRRETERQAEAQRIAAEQRQKAAAQQAAQQAAAQEAERQRQIREAQQKKLEQDRLAAARTPVLTPAPVRQQTSPFAMPAPLRQQTSPAPTDPSSLIGIWTCIEKSGFAIKPGFKKSPPEDWQFKEGGVLKSLVSGKENNSWVQNGKSVTVEYNNGKAIFELKIINPNLMKGTQKVIRGYNGSVEVRRK